MRTTVTLWGAALTLFASVAQAGPKTIAGPITNPGNGHSYLLLDSATWKDSEVQAVALGGHLATVRSQAEEEWIVQTFGDSGGQQRLLWIGLSDTAAKFHFGWSSKESVSYTCWAEGEPNNVGGGEDFVAIYYPGHSQGGKWNDWNDRTQDPIGLPMNGVVEIVPVASQRSAGRVDQPPILTIRPTLVITNESSSVKLQWPISASNYFLEATTNLTQPFTMFGYSETTDAESGMISVVVTNATPQLFFRLRKL